MEEDIFIVESFLKNKKMLLKHPCWVSEKTIQAIENLINKNKELEKMVELMAEEIDETDRGYIDYCNTKTKCDENCKKCIKEYFKKKARE